MPLRTIVFYIASALFLLVLFSAVLLVIRERRVKGKNGIKFWRKKWFQTVSAATVSVAAVFTVYSAQIEPYMLEVERVTLRPDGFPHAMDGLKCVLLSDFHQLNNERDLRRLDSIVEKANSLEPDMIFLLGDFMGRFIDTAGENASPELVAGKLKGLKAKYGVFAVLGNHDWWYGGEKVLKAFSDAGIPVLENSFMTVNANGAPLNIVGLPDCPSRGWLLDRKALPDPAMTPAIVLSHSPEFFETLNMDYPLMFSGHTHGGQVALPFMGAAGVRMRCRVKYLSGIYEDSGRLLYITRGLGTSVFKLRFNSVPELTLITIKAE